MVKLRFLKRLLVHHCVLSVLLLTCVMTALIAVYNNKSSTTKSIVSTMTQKAPLKHRCHVYFAKLQSKPVLGINDFFKYFESSGNLVESINQIKIFNKCYVENDFELGENAAVERLLFPFFKQEPEIPDYMDQLDGDATALFSPTVRWNDALSYWNNWARKTHGRGIAITIHPGQTYWLFKLLKVLELLENKLPIQIVHKGDLTKELQDFIVANRSAQQIWFVDVQKVIDPQYSAFFKRFNNKWLAILFSSFKEVILMDVDSIPFVKPDELFNLDEYRNTGALFFKDRFLPDEKLSPGEIEMFEQMVKDNDDVDFFELADSDPGAEAIVPELKYRHLVDSGIVLMDKETHMSGLLVSIVLQYWYKTSSAFYGDKELFWLGQSIAQNSFSIYDANASIIGTLTDGRICATQLGHLTKDKKELLWANGGLQICKKFMYAHDDYVKNENLRNRFESEIDLRNYYQAKLYINGSIIPDQWTSTDECIGYNYCCDKGERVALSAQKVDFYNKVSSVWNE